MQKLKTTKNHIPKIKPDMFEDLEDYILPSELKIVIPDGTLPKESISKV